MKKLSLFVVCTFIIIASQAQILQSDSIQTNNGWLRITPVSHASMVLSWNNKTIYVDPTGGAESYTSASRPDIILITDIHGDHMHAPTILATKQTNTRIIAPSAVADSLRNHNISNVIILSNGGKTNVEGITIEAIAAYNKAENPNMFHPKGRGNGYVLEMGGKRIYISGDTEDVPEMRELKNIDAAFVCMNLPYTMDIYQAKAGVLAFQPKIVYPYHFRGKEEMSDVQEFKRMVNEENKDIEVRLLNWYPDQNK